MTHYRTVGVILAALAGTAITLAPAAASARRGHAARHVTTQKSHVAAQRSGVRYGSTSRHGGTQALVSDGRGSGFGFYHNPGPFRVGAAIARDRQIGAVHQAVADSAIDSQPRFYGQYGDSVYGNGSAAAYGVFNGSDGYGSPYFAGYYGPGEGADYGVFGHAYEN